MQNISITLSSCNNLKTTMRDVVKTPYRSRISGDFTWTSGIERVGLWFYRRSEFRCKQAAQSRRKSPGSDRSKLEHDTQCRVNVGHRLHHWPNIEPTQGQCSVLLTGKCLLTLVFDKKKEEKNQKHVSSHNISVLWAFFVKIVSSINFNKIDIFILKKQFLYNEQCFYLN